jgi:Uma2 family endonuclease
MSTLLVTPTRPTSNGRAPRDVSQETLADLVERLGGIPLERIRLSPPLGTATEDDVLTAGKPYCELVDGVLVEKSMGYFEGRLASMLLVEIELWLRSNNIGYCNGEGAYTRLLHGRVRIPDVSFVRWERVQDHTVPRDPICGVAPSLAVEVLSFSNTSEEIERKRGEYFAAGVELVWIVDPEDRTVEVWTTARDCHIAEADDSLDGGQVLPGFQLSIRDWFARAELGATPNTPHLQPPAADSTASQD